MKITQSNGGDIVKKILDNLKDDAVSEDITMRTHFYLYNTDDFRGMVVEVRYKDEKYAVRAASDETAEFNDMCELLSVWLKLMGD